MIVIEGCDNSGKTTLALELSKAMGLVLVKNCIRPRESGEILSWAQFVRSFQPNDRLVLDRFSPISEIIYGETLRGKSLIKHRDAYIVLLSIAPQIVYCRPSRENILNFGTRPQMNGVEEHVDELIEAYDDFMRKLEEHLGLDIIRYDYGVDTPQDIVNQLRQPAGEVH